MGTSPVLSAHQKRSDRAGFRRQIVCMFPCHLVGGPGSDGTSQDRPPSTMASTAASPASMPPSDTGTQPVEPHTSPPTQPGPTWALRTSSIVSLTSMSYVPDLPPPPQDASRRQSDTVRVGVGFGDTTKFYHTQFRIPFLFELWLFL